MGEERKTRGTTREGLVRQSSSDRVRGRGDLGEPFYVGPPRGKGSKGNREEGGKCVGLVFWGKSVGGTPAKSFHGKKERPWKKVAGEGRWEIFKKRAPGEPAQGAAGRTPRRKLQMSSRWGIDPEKTRPQVRGKESDPSEEARTSLGSPRIQRGPWLVPRDQLYEKG